MKITNVRVFVQTGNKGGKKPINPKGSWLSNSVIANPMSYYPEYFDKRSSWTGGGGRVIVMIETDEGVTGYGEGTAGTSSAPIIKQHLAKFLIGESPFAVEKHWDIMFRVSLPYGRKGAPIMAISAVDLALWDLCARLRNEPLYQTLGGPVKDFVPAYVTGNEYVKCKDRGFLGQKLAMPYGPASGYEGMKKNVELIKDCRETLGPDKEIMLDCYMAWNVDYTIKMAEMIEPYRVKWIEESLQPDDYKGYGIINEKITSSTIATGEHEYTRWGFQQLLDVRGAEIFQPDIVWCGGLTEVKKISAMASANYIPIIPHGGGLTMWALHQIFADPNIPMAEFAFVNGADYPNHDAIFEGTIQPENGVFHLPKGVVGTGLSLREGAMELLTEL